MVAYRIFLAAMILFGLLKSGFAGSMFVILQYKVRLNSDIKLWLLKKELL